MSFAVGDRVVPTEEARRTLFGGNSPHPNHRYPTVGKTVGTITNKSSMSYWTVIFDKDDGGEFPTCQLEAGHDRFTHYGQGNLEWLLADSEMEKYVPVTATANAEVEAFKKKTLETAARARRNHPGKATSIDEILKEVGLLTGPKELKKGSVVRHPDMSVTYTRPWGFPTDGGNNWRCSDKYGSGPSELPWTEVVRLCNGAPVVLLDTNGDIDYTNADIRHGVKKAQA